MQSFIKLLKNPLGFTGFVLIFFWAIIAIFAPMIAPPGSDHVGSAYTITRIGFSSLPKAPSSEAIFGTTGGGYDIFYGLIWGSRTAFLVGLGVVGAAAVRGFLVGEQFQGDAGEPAEVFACSPAQGTSPAAFDPI